MLPNPKPNSDDAPRDADPTPLVHEPEPAKKTVKLPIDDTFTGERAP